MKLNELYCSEYWWSSPQKIMCDDYQRLEESANIDYVIYFCDVCKQSMNIPKDKWANHQTEHECLP